MKDHGARRRSGRFVHVPMSIVLLTFGTLAAGCTSSSDSQQSRDAKVTYCLTASRKSAVAETAVILGLARAGTTSQNIAPVDPKETEISVDDWKETYAADFERACNALIATNGLTNSGQQASQPHTTKSLLSILLPVAVGALLTLVATEWRATRERRRVEAANVRQAFTAFRQTISDYATALSEATVQVRPSTQAIDQCRIELAATLRRMRALFGQNQFIEAIGNDLDGVAYRTGLTSAPLSDRESRMMLANKLEKLVADLASDAEQVATWTEKPFRNRLHNPRTAPLSHVRLQAK